MRNCSVNVKEKALLRACDRRGQALRTLSEATLPRLVCNQIAKDPRSKVRSAPLDLGTFPMDMAWHVRYRQDPAHRWLRQLLVETAAELSAHS